MILVDHQITERCQAKRKIPVSRSFEREEDQTPMIEPFNPEQVEPASYDVILGNDFRVFERNAETQVDMSNPVDITKHVHIPDGKGFTLHPGEFILGVTMEKVNMPNNLVARLEGKSSVGRLGVMVHVTAGYIDPGFSGCITLEMTSLHPLPIILRPGKAIAQLSFHLLSGEPTRTYQGRYQGDTTVQASRYGMSKTQVMGRRLTSEPAKPDVWGRLLREDGTVDTEMLPNSHTRLSPDDGNAYVLADKWPEGDKPAGGHMARITDLFGGHEINVRWAEWESWPEYEREDN